ncbi:MAG: restriction endonuclease [Candidatus Marinimicrobia bacterium]|nr:restriction endonuclease [Candidatus Neomarinimicrobiota bacterium]
MLEIKYNPDVLSCLANLSSDEVFTPPNLANDILDLLPKEIWSDPEITFLDPVSKSGVFLREIAKRLMTGLQTEIPDKQERINHIFTKQIYGIAITELTSLLSRRSVYCTKTANNKYSVCEDFEDEQGNIIFARIEHTWKKGRCAFCGASEEVYKDRDELETHAYQFIHTENPEEIFNMKFDVIVGNPPYQLSDGGFGKSATPLYHKFVEQAKKLNPHFLVMIIPARWFAGGKGLKDFRGEMLNDSQIREIVDFENASDCFPGVDIAGGICYFLWEKDSDGPCEVLNIQNGVEVRSTRALNEFSTFVRHGKAVSIIRKILANKENKMNEQVSSRKPFGIATNTRPQNDGDITLRWQKGEGPYKRDEVTVGTELIDKWKVITSYVGYDHAGNPGKDGRRRVFSKIDILPPKTICTETYLVVGSFEKEYFALNLVAYMKTRFFRFLVAQFMYSHHITKDSYAFVPLLDMTANWTDEQLYERYQLSDEEIVFIESKIRPMELVHG